MFYLSEIYKHKCRCGKLATHELKTSGSTNYGYYCRKCAKREVVSRNKAEEAYHQQGGC